VLPENLGNLRNLKHPVCGWHLKPMDGIAPSGDTAFTIACIPSTVRKKSIEALALTFLDLKP
jgi:hypothetical protein